MRYYYEKPETYQVTKAKTISTDDKLYSECTLYELDGRGLKVVQLRFNEKLKAFFYGPIDPWLVDDIFAQEGFGEMLSDPPYPTVTVRTLMWKLRMKPLRKEWWEDSQNLQII